MKMMNDLFAKKHKQSLFVRLAAFGTLAIAIVFSAACQNAGQSGLSDAEERAAAGADYREPSQTPPGGLTQTQVPQFVIFGYDDNQYADGMTSVLNVYKNKTNPAGSGNALTFDGAPVHVSFYMTPGGRDETTGETWTIDGDTLASWKLAYQSGHEIGNHTFYHGHGLAYDEAKWAEEISNCTNWLVSNVGVPKSEIVGFRVPFLEYTASTFTSLKAQGLQYDVSFEGGWRYWPAETGSTLFWPFTMDNGKPANEDGRDFGKVPGVWEIPDDCIFFPDGSRTTGLDYNLWFSKETTKAQFVAALKNSLDKKYTGNRCPMNFGLHSNYYSAAGEEEMKKYDAASYAKLKATLSERQAALAEVLAYALSLPDVRVVSAKEALQWLKSPVALGQTPGNQYTITSTAGSNGTVSPLGQQKVVEGTSKTYYFNANPGYLIDTVIVDGSNLGAIETYTFTNVTANHTVSVSFKTPSLENKQKSTILSLTNVAENSQTRFAWGYAENINDGRGITFGIAGFTSGTYDGTILIRRIKELDPANVLASYLPAFEAIDASPHVGDKTDNITGLGNFISDFNAHGSDPKVQQAQLEKIDELYWIPAMAKATEIGATLQITKAFLYDTCINHGVEGDGTDKGMGVLVSETITAMGGTPKTGINEISWLTKMLDVRKAYMQSDPTWAQALDRIEMFRRILTAGNTSLTTPLSVTCYDEPFTIYGTEIVFPEEQGTLYQITASAGSNGSISPSGSVSIGEGRSLTFIISPNSGYIVEQVIVDGSNKGALESYTFSSINANHSISATFKLNPVQQYTITASAGSNGTISPSGSVLVNKNASQTFTITPASGYAIDTLTVDGAAATAASSYVFSNVTANHSINATFKKVTSGCTLPVWSASETYTNGNQVHYNGHDWKAQWWTKGDVPGAGGEWGVWKDLGVCNGGTVTEYTITATAGSNGSISPSGAVKVNDGDSKAFTITPSSGYEVNAVTVNGSSVGAVTSYTFTNVKSNQTISVTFKAITVTQYTITSSAGANGIISPSGSTTVSDGGSKTYTMTPSSGYEVNAVTVNGSSVGAVTSYTFTNVKSNQTISVTFKAITVTQYTITSSAGSNGSISPSGSTTVNSGSSKTYTFTPSSGYVVATVTVDGSSVSVANSYTFTNVTANHTISVTFAASGIAAWASGVTYQVGDKVTYGGFTWKNTYLHTSNDAWYPGASGLWFWEKI